MSRMGITVYLPPELEQKVLRVAKARNLSASGIISSAVKNQFADNPNGVPEGVTRQFARVEARLDRVMRDNAIMKEAFFFDVRVWLEHSRSIPRSMTPRLTQRAHASSATSISCGRGLSQAGLSRATGRADWSRRPRSVSRERGEASG